MTPKHSGWTAHPDGSHTAKIGRYKVTIHPAAPWKFWRGDHKGEPTHTGPGTSHMISFHASAEDGLSGTKFTLEGAKADAVWRVANDLTGKRPPDAVLPPEELEARRVWEETVAYVNATYGDR